MYDLEQAKQRVAYLDRLRLQRALENSSASFQQVLALLPLLFHCNHPSLVGYVKDCPKGVSEFQLSRQQSHFLQHCFSHFSLDDCLAFTNAYPQTQPALLGIYAMGSISTISQTPNSDLDVWLCTPCYLSTTHQLALQKKMALLQQWASDLGVKISLYLLNEQYFRDSRYTASLSAENDHNGSAQYMLLLDEFYRTAIRLAGKPLLWLHLPVAENQYDTTVKKLVQEKKLHLAQWVDFGGLGQLSANEFFGATLWQLYKGIDSPYKSILKLLLLESYSHDYPHTKIISQIFKQRLHQGDMHYHYDAYLCMLDQVADYLSRQQDYQRLDFAHRCFYLKIAENYPLNKEQENENNWRLTYLKKLTQQWQWDEHRIYFLNKRPYWKIKWVKEHHNDLVRYLMVSYRNLLRFVRQHKINASIASQDMAILSRKLYTAFEDIPEKVMLINSAITSDLSEKTLTFIEVKNNVHFKQGWYLINHAPNMELFASSHHIEFSETLPKLVAWSYFNGLLTSKTELYLRSQHVRLIALRRFVQDLRQTFPLKQVAVAKHALIQQCEIRKLCIAINLTLDPTEQLPSNSKQYRKQILSSNLLNITESHCAFVGSIDIIYCNRWEEIRTLHFTGNDALIRALKVLSRKIPRGSRLLKEVSFFSYAMHYKKELHLAVQGLIYRTLGIKSKHNLIKKPLTSPRIHLTGYCWHQLFCSKTARQDHSLQPQDQYLQTITPFASEGFLQFFFHNNPNGTFNVYILDEHNHLEVYYACEGETAQKIQEINQIYQRANLNTQDNHYKIVRRQFNYPQFYQLLPTQDTVSVVPYPYQLKLT